jgi:hypothetical protein
MLLIPGGVPTHRLTNRKGSYWFLDLVRPIGAKVRLQVGGRRTFVASEPKSHR